MSKEREDSDNSAMETDFAEETHNSSNSGSAAAPVLPLLRLGSLRQLHTEPSNDAANNNAAAQGNTAQQGDVEPIGADADHHDTATQG